MYPKKENSSEYCCILNCSQFSGTQNRKCKDPVHLKEKALQNSCFSVLKKANKHPAYTILSLNDSALGIDFHSIDVPWKNIIGYCFLKWLSCNKNFIHKQS